MLGNAVNRACSGLQCNECMRPIIWRTSRRIEYISNISGYWTFPLQDVSSKTPTRRFLTTMPRRRRQYELSWMLKFRMIPESAWTCVDYNTFVENFKYCRFVSLIIHVGEKVLPRKRPVSLYLLALHLKNLYRRTLKKQNNNRPSLTRTVIRFCILNCTSVYVIDIKFWWKE